MTTTTATLNLGGVAEFWRVARRLYTVYAELDRTFELGMTPCAELEDTVDRPDAEARERVLQWFEQIDGHVQVWQLRQLLQNLIGNAIKSRRPGEPPRIHVSVAALVAYHGDTGARRAGPAGPLRGGQRSATLELGSG